MTDSAKFILYVDDDEDDRQMLSDAIRYANQEVKVALAENGLEALDYLTSIKTSGERLPCLIVLDINMPFLDGKETFERLKTDSVLKAVPVIVFSSSQKPADKMQFNSLGIEYFPKPYDIGDMAKIVNHMINVCC